MTDTFNNKFKYKESMDNFDITRTFFRSKNVDIATFSETWLTSGVTDELIKFKGYTR